MWSHYWMMHCVRSARVIWCYIYNNASSHVLCVTSECDNPTGDLWTKRAEYLPLKCSHHNVGKFRPSLDLSICLSLMLWLTASVVQQHRQAQHLSRTWKGFLKSCTTFHPKYATCFVPTSCAHVDQTRADKTGRKYRVWGISYIFTYSLCTHILYIFRLIQQKRGLCSVSESDCSHTPRRVLHQFHAVLSTAWYKNMHLKCCRIPLMPWCFVSLSLTVCCCSLSKMDKCLCSSKMLGKKKIAFGNCRPF